MTVGIRIKGDDGYLQIDDRYRNSAIVAQGTGTTTTTWYNAFYTTVNVTGLNNPKIAVLSLNGYGISVVSTAVSGSGTSKSVTWLIFGSNSNAQFAYYVFDTISTTTSGSVGVRFRDSSGNVIFDSNYKYMRVAFSSATGYDSRVSGRTYATIFSGGVVQRVTSGGTGNSAVQTTTAFSTNGEITIRQNVGSNANETTFYYAYSYLLVDVTNY